MRKHSLSTTGLSMSQAQSISNLCNQRALSIENRLKNVNSASKSIKVDGSERMLQKANKIPTDVLSLLVEMGSLRACQAFLMENIKAKDKMIRVAKSKRVDTSDIPLVERPEYLQPSLLNQVDEDWGWDQLSVSEMNEFYEVEAHSAHIGKFIHKGSALDRVRNETDVLPALEWMTIVEGTKSPVTITPNHSSEELLSIHEKLAEQHRIYESRTNYFKAKVNNLVTVENARIAEVNSKETTRVDLINQEMSLKYTAEMRDYNNLCSAKSNKFEEERQELIKGLVTLKIKVDPRFQDTVNLFLGEKKEA